MAIIGRYFFSRTKYARNRGGVIWLKLFTITKLLDNIIITSDLLIGHNWPLIRRVSKEAY